MHTAPLAYTDSIMKIFTCFKQPLGDKNCLMFFSVAANADELLALPTENSTHVNRCKADTSQQEVYLPTANWQNEQINQFTNVRLKISRHFALSKKEQHQVEENSKIKTPKVQ